MQLEAVVSVVEGLVSVASSAVLTIFISPFVTAASKIVLVAPLTPRIHGLNSGEVETAAVAVPNKSAPVLLAPLF